MSNGRAGAMFFPLALFCGLLLTATGGQVRAASLGVHDYEVAGVQVILLSVKRTSDGFITTKWAYHNTTNKAKTIGQSTGAMSGAWSAPFSFAWDFFLMAGGQQYKVANGPGGLLAGKHGGGMFSPKTLVLGPKKTYSTWAKVKDPGPDVKTVSVSIQGADPFDDIPVQ